MDQDTSVSSQPVDTDPIVATELRGFWSELLFVDGVDDADNFVALGGDSIAATLCTMRINTTFGVELPTAWLLERSTTFGMVVSRIATQLNSAAR